MLMKTLKNLSACGQSTVTVLLMLNLAFATALRAETKPLKLVELYTAHGCSSCPSADRLLGELLAEHDALLALEFHVDYWNSLVHGSDGNFVDPFSDSAYSARQRAYNLAGLRGRPGVYTPQAVINGRVATVGSNRKQIEKALSQNIEPVVDIRMRVMDASGRLSVSLTASNEQRQKLSGIDVVLVRYIDKASTEITGGENRHLVLENHHIVADLRRIGEMAPVGELLFDIAAPPEGQGCVVLVQEGALTPVYGAAGCP